MLPWRSPRKFPDHPRTAPSSRTSHSYKRYNRFLSRPRHSQSTIQVSTASAMWHTTSLRLGFANPETTLENATNPQSSPRRAGPCDALPGLAQTPSPQYLASQANRPTLSNRFFGNSRKWVTQPKPHAKRLPKPAPNSQENP